MKNTYYEERTDFGVDDRDDTNIDHYCSRPYRTLRYTFFESLSDISERFLGPVDLFCDPKIKAEIKSATEKPRLLEAVPPDRVPSISPVRVPEPTQIVPITVTTSKRELAEVLGKVVNVVIAAERLGSSDYDYSALNTLFIKDNDREHCDDEGVSLTYQELQKIVTQIVLSSRESVKERIGIPGGIVISNLGPDNRVVDLSWAC